MFDFPQLSQELWLAVVGIMVVLAVIIVWLLLRVKYQARVAVLEERLTHFGTEAGSAALQLREQEQELDALHGDTRRLENEATQLRVQVGNFIEHRDQYEDWRAEAREEMHVLSQSNVALKERVSHLETQLQAERDQAAEKLKLLEDARQNLTAEFKVLANEIFDDKSRKFTQQNAANLETVLKPLAGQLTDFQKRVEETYDKEARERFSLVREIRGLQELNSRISEDAVNLTRALRGDSKTQGSWGELTLERILEASGLVKGREYDIQVSLKGEQGERLQPDVIVHLPDNKDVIVDSKVTLKAYHDFVASDDDKRRESAAQRHLQSITSHIRDLSGKDYQNLPDLRTLDFVLLFLPVEDAFSLAVQRDPQLFATAFESNIVLVGPSTLLATLRTIQHIWRNEHQSQNAREIARRAGDLYDKFVNFIGDVEEIGQRLDKAGEAYDRAHNRLTSGRGNLVSRAETLKKLGAKTSKQIGRTLVDRADHNAEIVEIGDKK